MAKIKLPVSLWILLLYINTCWSTSTAVDSALCSEFVRRASSSVCENPHIAKYCPESCRNHTLTCYSCAATPNPNQCSHNKLCQKGEVCAAFGTLDASFHRVYHLDCVPQHTCNMFIYNNKRSSLQPADCCNTTRCNRRLIEAPHNLTCYSCPKSSNPNTCTHRETCKPGQLCVITQSLDENFHWTYRLGCMDQSSCEVFKHDGLPGKRSVTGQGDCCDTDLCNHPTHHVTQPTTKCRDVHFSTCAMMLTQNLSACTDNTFKTVFCPFTCNVCNSNKGCADINPKVCEGIGRNPSISCNDDIIKNHFCRQRCKTCINCYHCNTKAPEACHSYIGCNPNSQKCSLQIVQPHHTHRVTYQQSCVSKAMCDHTNSTILQCCDGDKCNKPSLLATTLKPSTTKTPSTTTAKVSKSTTHAPTTSTTQKPTTITTKAPTSTTHAPTSTTQKPTTITTKAPTSTTHAPTTSTTAAPTSTTHAPTSTTHAPTTSTTAAPTSTTHAPTSTTHAPLTPSTVPTSTTHAPTSTTHASTSTTHAPTTPSTVPTSTTHAPTSTTHASTSTTHAPTTPSTVPTTSTTHAPITSTNTPHLIWETVPFKETQTHNYIWVTVPDKKP